MIKKEKNTRKLVLIMFTFLGLILMIHSCKHSPDITGMNTEPDPDPDPDISNICHPDTVYFNQDLMPLLGASCGRAGCHDAATQADGVRLTDYESVMETGDVRPGRPDNSDLFEVIVDDDPDDRMPPPPNEPLLTEQIEKIRTWINQGALNLQCEEQDCDLNDVSFSGRVQPILALNGCVSCHSGSNPQGGVRLDSYANVSAVVESGRLMGAIRHLSGYVPMPLNGEKIGECQADQIERWISNGMPND
jgi:hypothetical protein